MRLAALALLAGLIAQAEQTARQPPVFRARTELVQVDVVVVDADGHVVEGLTERDFQIFDRGRLQRVAAFQEISHGRAGLAPLPVDLKVDVADNARQPDRLIVLVLDDLHFQAKTAEVKAISQRVVSDIGPGAALALVTTSGSFGVEPTEDRALMLAAIDGFLDRFDPEMRRLVPGAHPPPPSLIRNAMGEPVRERGPSKPLNEFFGDMTMYKTIEDVAKRVGAGAAGRRNAFIWIAGGLNAPASSAAACETSEGNSHYCGALAGLLEALRKSNVTAYSIATGDFSSQMLRDVADASGGFVMRAESFDHDAGRLIDDLDHYYLLGFYPDDSRDRDFHPLDVRVDRPGVTVRFRRGYKPGEAPKGLRNSRPLARLAEGVLPVSDVPLRMFAAPVVQANAARTRTAVAIEIRADRARLAERDGFLRDVLEYEVWAVDLRKKKPVKSVAREAQLVLDPAEAAAHPGDPVVFQVHTALPLDPGRYQLRASLTSAKAGKGGSVYLETEIPELKKDRLDVVSVVLGYADGPKVPIVRGGAGVGLLPIHPTLDREFTPSDMLRVVCDVVKPATAAVTAAVDLLTAEGTHSKRLWSEALARGPSSRIDTNLSLEGLAAGGYRLRVSTADGSTSADREIGFVVR
jgi:VWFA-related protein